MSGRLSSWFRFDSEAVAAAASAWAAFSGASFPPCTLHPDQGVPQDDAEAKVKTMGELEGGTTVGR